MYICDFSRSVGAGSATTRNTRGLTRSVIALIVPPLPAPSRPSKMTQTFNPLCTTHCWSLTSSTCSFFSSARYCLLPSGCGGSVPASADGAASSDRARWSLLSLLLLLPFFAIVASCGGFGSRPDRADRPRSIITGQNFADSPISASAWSIESPRITTTQPPEQKNPPLEWISVA